MTDDFRDHQIAALTRMRNLINRHCEIVEALVPDNISETTQNMLAPSGSRLLDAAFLAARTDSVLLCDDMRLRELSRAANGVEGTWIQAALLAAAAPREISAPTLANAVVGLAEHRHDHLVLSAAQLYVIARQDGPGFPGLRSAMQCLGGPNAEIRLTLPSSLTSLPCSGHRTTRWTG